jgi:adenylate cyclase
LGWPLSNVRGYAAADVHEAYTRAREAHRRTGDGIEPYQALWGLAMCHLVRAEYARTRALGDEILRLAESTRDAGARVTAHYMLGTVLLYLGEVAASRDHYEQGIALADADPRLTLPDDRDPGMSCRAQMGRVLWLLGYPEQARAMSEAALARARRAQHPLALAFALFLDMLRRQMSRDVDGAARVAEELSALTAEHDLVQYRAWAEIVFGWAQAIADPAVGIGQLRESLAAYERMGSELSRPHFLALLAEALGAAGRQAEALSVIKDALASVARTNERYYLAELYRLVGLLAMRSPDAAFRATARECFERAAAMARQQGARSWELRALATLARHEAGGWMDAAVRARLSDVYGWFTEGLDQPDQVEARALLDATQPD